MPLEPYLHGVNEICSKHVPYHEASFINECPRTPALKFEATLFRLLKDYLKFQIGE